MAIPRPRQLHIGRQQSGRRATLWGIGRAATTRKAPVLAEAARAISGHDLT
jgi:hypothetical protein